MKLMKTQIVEIDLDAERERLNKCFTGAKLKRHLEILDCFEKGEWERCVELYENLPYDENGEYPEQENVGGYIKFAFSDYPFYNEYEMINYGAETFSILETDI